MERARLGATGIDVSRFCMGTMTFANPADEETSFSLLDLAVEHGIDFIDTANMYSAGRAEKILGRWMRKRNNRDELVIASKIRYAVGGDPKTAGLNPRVIHQQLVASLERLGTDFLDILYLHQPDDRTPIETTLRCLQDLVQQGRIRAIGLSNFAAWQVVEALMIADRHGWTKPLVTQPMYNLLARGIETEFLPMAKRFDLPSCTYNPLAGGLLTGKYEGVAELPSGTRLSESLYYRERYWQSSLTEASRKLHNCAREHGRTLTELSLRFLLDSPHVTCLLLGASHPEQLTENLAALDSRPLDDEEHNQCNRIWESLNGSTPKYCRTDEDAKPHAVAPRPKATSKR